MVTDHGDVDEAELLRRLRMGDVGALDTLYRSHGRDALRYARRLSRPGVSAVELVSEAFARTLGAISRGRGPFDSFRPYLFTVVRRAARHLQWRADTVLSGLDPAPAVADAGTADARLGAGPAAPDGGAVMVALHRLPDR